MKTTYDLHVEKFIPLTSPAEIKKLLPVSEGAYKTVVNSRKQIGDILSGRDKRLLIITGPCSIHDEKAGIEYAMRLKDLSKKVKDTMLLVMRVYFEKPRTNVGWKGLINDPWLNDSHDINEGLKKARSLLLKITELGVPTATEILDPITPQYIAGLVCWTAVGARTTESQTHREMASGLSMPVGFKNCTDGNLSTALNAMIAAGSPQSFIGIDASGKSCIVKTTGNPFPHIVLRGGSRPNYDSFSVNETVSMLKAKGLLKAVVVDCSHGNSRKNHKAQTVVWQDLINQHMDGNESLIGMMLESNLDAGNQKNTGDLSTMKYGVSITDACISWETTEKLIVSAHDQLLWNKKNSAGTPNQASGARYKLV